MAQKWVLLIGIDFYIQGIERNIQFGNLTGCVQDVLALEGYFRRVVGVRNITKLTASPGGDRPAEEENAWPTHDNIVRELNRITGAAKAGDLVYIYYSGHGIRRDKKFSADGGDNISGTALAPTDVMAGGAYLTGYELGVRVRSMVEKQLRVTVILDSCFSGRGLRNNSTFRTAAGQSDDSMLESDKFAEASAFAADIHGDDTLSQQGQRNAIVQHSWLSNPTNCSVLTACGVHEVASEDVFGGYRHGVLTHHILETLVRYPSNRLPSYARLNDLVRWKLASRQRPQSPVLHGDSYYEFFGERLLAQRPTCVVSETADGLELEVGRAQGVAIGAIYDVCPQTWETECTSFTESNGREHDLHELSQVRIIKVSDFQSTAQPLSTMDLTPNETVPTSGNRAALQTYALPLPTYIRMDIPPDMPGIERLESSLQVNVERTPHLYLSPSDAANEGDFIVSIDTDKTFRILDEHGVILTGTPEVSTKDEDGVQKLAYILRHLARFRAVKTLQYGGYQRSLQPERFLFELQDGNRIPLRKNPFGEYECVDGQEVIVSLVDTWCTEPVHVAIFNLNATWGIEKLHPQSGQPTEETEEDEPVAFQICMEICNKSDEVIDDVIRAYVSVGDHPPSWDELALPDLPAESSLVQIDRPTESLLNDVLLSTTDSRNTKNPKPLLKSGGRARGIRWTALDLAVRTFRAVT